MKLLDKRNNNFIKIDNEDLNDAKLSSTDYSNDSTKKRAFINVLGARLAMKMLFSKKLEANNAYSLYTIHNILKELDIADIYLNDVKIDVRLVFDRNEIFIPKSQFKSNILPDLYVVLELKSDFSGADCLGFFEPKDLNKENANTDFYFFECDKLRDIDEIKDFLKDFSPEEKPEASEEDFDKAEIMFLSMAESTLNNDDKMFLLKQLKNSSLLRERFVEFENFELISRVTAKDDSILGDSVLGIVGAQDAFEEEALTATEEKAEIIGEVLDDMLDEEVGADYSKKTKADDDDSFEKELKDEVKNKKSSNKIAENTAKGLATGIGIGGAIAAGSLAAGAAEAQVNAAKAGLDAVSSGLDLGSKVADNLKTNKAAKKQPSAATNDINDLLNEIESSASTEDTPDLGEINKPDVASLSTSATNSDDLDLDALSELLEDDTTEAKTETNDLDLDSLLETVTDSASKDDDLDLDALSEMLEEEPSDSAIIEQPKETEPTEKQIETEEAQDLTPEPDLTSEPELTPEPELRSSTKEVEPEISIDEDDAAFEDSEGLIEDLPDLDLGDIEEIEPIEESEVPVNKAETSIVENIVPAKETETEAEQKTEDKETSDFDLQSFDFEEEDNSSKEDIKDTENEDDDLSFIETANTAASEELSFEAIKNQTEDDSSITNDVPFKILDDDSDMANEDSQPEAISNEDKFLILDENDEPEQPSAQEAPLEEKAVTEENDDAASSKEDELTRKFREYAESKAAEEAEKAQEETVDEQANNSINETTEDEDLMQELADLEIEDETTPSKEDTESENTEDEDLNFEVDDFLKNIELSDEDTSILEDTLSKIDAETTQEDDITTLTEAELKASKPQDDSTLQMLFNEGEATNEMPEEAPKVDLLPSTKKDKKMVVAASIASVVLVSLIIGGSILHNKTQTSVQPPVNTQKIATQSTTSDTINNNENPSDQGLGPDINSPDSKTSSATSGNASNMDMGRAVTDALSSEPVNTSITKVAWAVPEDLAYNDGFRSYLQVAGKNLKLNLQNALLLATEVAYSNKVVVDLSIGQDGSLIGSKIVKTSGSKQIDQIVLQSVKETLKYLKMPSSELGGKSASATLIINF